MSHTSAVDGSLHLTQQAKDWLEGLDHLARLLVREGAAGLTRGGAPGGGVHGALGLRALAGGLLAGAVDVPSVVSDKNTKLATLRHEDQVILKEWLLTQPVRQRQLHQ